MFREKLIEFFIYLNNKFLIENSQELYKVFYSCVCEFYLENKFRVLSKTDIQLKDIYPYLFNNELLTKYSITEKEFYKFFEYSIFNEEDFLGKFYESYLSLEKRKELGSFYTRNHILIDEMIDSCKYLESNIKKVKILEPSCGSGMILINLIRKLKNIPSLSPLEKLKIIVNNYYAIDIDEVSCLITEFNIINEILDLIVDYIKFTNSKKLAKLKIYCNDFTKVPLNNKPILNEEEKKLVEENEIMLDLKTRNNFFEEGFDIILGNPPFITMYGKRSINMTNVKRNFYNLYYDFLLDKRKNNKFNSSMLFIERALKILLPGQKLSFILDISFFETAFKDIRCYILKNCKILNIISEISSFQVGSGQIILTLEKGYIKGNNSVWKIYDSNILQEINQDIWLNENNEYKIFLELNLKDKTIISKIEEETMLLGEIFPKKELRTCCALTGKSKEFMTSYIEYKNDTKNIIFPYLEGAKGVKNKFSKIYPTDYFKYDYELQQKISEEFKVELEKLGVKNKKRIALGDYESYLSPKIFIRQSAKELIATYTEEKAAANNSIYIISLNKNDLEKNKLLKYICGLLNSSLLSFYAQKNKIIRMSLGKTPQIKLSDLKKLPIKKENIFYEKIIEIVEEILKNPEKKIDNYLVELDKLVFSLYKIDLEYWEYIKLEVNNFKN